MLKYKLVIYLLIIVFSPLFFGQEDSSKTEEDWNWHWNWDEWDDWSDWQMDFGFRNSQPAISLQYGLAKVDRKDIQTKFVDPALIEIKLGYIKDRAAWGTDNIIKHNYRYFYLSNESNQLSGKENSISDIESDMWRVGFGRSGGYGYKLGESSAIILYNSSTMNWSNIDFKYPTIMTVDPLDRFAPVTELDIINLYEGSFRFGTSSEGGIRIKLINNIMLDAGYERSVVFQRHLFWKWAGSAIIEAAAEGLLDTFINEIFKSSPAAGPVVNFVLKNTLAYGIYELRKDKMNWPFNSESPITYDQFKFGMTFVF